MSKAFFDELHITALMAAPSVGRRSWYHSPSDIKKSGGLVQSRRWLYGRVKGLLYDGFFLLPSSGRLLYLLKHEMINH